MVFKNSDVCWSVYFISPVILLKPVPRTNMNGIVMQILQFLSFVQTIKPPNPKMIVLTTGWDGFHAFGAKQDVWIQTWFWQEASIHYQWGYKYSKDLESY